MNFVSIFIITNNKVLPQKCCKINEETLGLTLALENAVQGWQTSCIKVLNSAALLEVIYVNLRAVCVFTYLSFADNVPI